MFKDYNSGIVTPKSRQCYGTGIRYVSGEVKNADSILTPGGEAASLIYPDGGEAPIIILDMGPWTPGGYPVFKVKSASENAVVRISYSDTYKPIIDPVYGKKGDFKRGCCKYLGVELPVLPANPGRFELYTVKAGEEYLSPLIQGQQRFVRIQLENPETSVELESFYIHYTSDMSEISGGFKSDHEGLDKLWYASVYTCQLASFTHDAWDTLNGWLFPRGLTQGNDCGILKDFENLTDYRFSFTARISHNPYGVSGIGFAFRAKDQDNGYVFRLDLDGSFHTEKRVGSVYYEIKAPVFIGTVTDNNDLDISVCVKGNEFTTRLNGKVIDVTCDDTFAAGTVGFCQMQEKWAMVKDLCVEDLSSGVLFSDDFKNGLSAYTFSDTPPFISDGAKRDRLPWSGDLDWAGRNVYYSMRNHEYMTGALDIIAFHQTEEGYCYGTCYPENKVPPQNRNYGHYESDIFSAWFVITAADYYLFSGNVEHAERYYGHSKRCLDYLWRFVEQSGLFFQRYETSKGLWDHTLGDYGRNGYNNLIVYDAMCEGAFMARNLGYTEDAERFELRAAHMKQGILNNLTDRDGWIVCSETNRDFCHMSNSYALAIGFFDDTQTAAKIMDIIMSRKPETGKVVSTNIRGAYAYGLEERAFNQFTVYHEVETDWGYKGGVGWLKMFKDDDVPHTTYECMTYPMHFAGGCENWGDASHPDTAMAHIMSGFILGIQPTSPGFDAYEIKPCMYGLTGAAGIVPVPSGEIEVDIENQTNTFCIKVRLDTKGKSGTLMLPAKGNKQVYKDGNLITAEHRGDRLCVTLTANDSGTYEVK